MANKPLALKTIARVVTRQKTELREENILDIDWVCQGGFTSHHSGRNCVHDDHSILNLALSQMICLFLEIQFLLT